MELAGKKVLFVFVIILRCTERLGWDKMGKGVGNGLITFNYNKKKIVRLWGTDYKARSVNETASQTDKTVSFSLSPLWMDAGGFCW